MNDLAIIEKIGNKLQQPRKEIVFPLTPTHRKELRELRNANVGGLRDRLRTIKSLKRDEYYKKYSSDIEKDISKKEIIVKKLNNDWESRKEKLQKILSERKDLEDSFDLKFLCLDTGYNDIAQLKVNMDIKRKYSFDKKSVIRNLSDEEFDLQYKNKFSKVDEIIDDITTKYEEAINFGDLEIVKQLYYTMKNSDKFFTKISDLKI